MSRRIRIHDVPSDLYARLKAHAARSAVSLSDYLLQELRWLADRPTLEKLRGRLNHRMPVTPSIPPVKAVRRERDGGR